LAFIKSFVSPNNPVGAKSDRPQEVKCAIMNADSGHWAYNKNKPAKFAYVIFSYLEEGPPFFWRKSPSFVMLSAS
jgi:hypothetical protein